MSRVRKHSRRITPAARPLRKGSEPGRVLAFEAISDPTRRAILDGLRGGVRSAGQIAEWFSVSRPAVSRHLRVLRSARLVSEERLGRKRMYRLEPGPLTEVDRWLSAYRVFWVARLIDLKEMLESEPSGEGDTQEKNS